jgi:protein-disulfide isomerase/uncharacterized membrane protein
MDAFLKQGLLGLAAVAAAIAAVVTVAIDAPHGLIGWVIAGVLLCASVIARDARFGVLLTSMGCFAANAYLFHRKWDSAMGTPAICSINATFDCDKVNGSPYSMAFGIPITLLGMGFYAGLGVAALALAEDDPVKARRFHQLNALFAIVNLVYSAFLGFHSYQMGVFCILCMSIYAGNALLLWAGLAGLKRTGGKLLDDVVGIVVSRDFLTLVASFLVVVGVGAWTWKAQGASVKAELAAASPDTLGQYYERASGPVQMDGTEPVFGDPHAAYTILEFADFGCPHCAAAFKPLHDLVKKNPAVQLRFKAYPLTGVCNPPLQPNGPERCQAAGAAECARQQGKFDAMAETLFDNQGYFADDQLEFMATQVGLDVDKFKACLADPATRAGIIRDAEAGNTAGVQGTPTLYLKGTAGDQWVLVKGGPDQLAAIVDAAAKGEKLPPPGPPSPPRTE